MSFLTTLQRAVDWGRRNSPWIIHFNAGACNGCDIEVVDALTPRFDVERFGLLQQGTPRHADILVCTGAVTLQTRDRLLQIYEQMPEPKFVVAVGSCACTGGVFDGCYCVAGGIDSVIPVDAYLPGCAARPEALIDMIVKLLDAWRRQQAIDRNAPPPAPLYAPAADQPDQTAVLDDGVSASREEYEAWRAARQNAAPAPSASDQAQPATAAEALASREEYEAWRAARQNAAPAPSAGQDEENLP